MASWLVGSSPDRVVRVRSLAEDTVLCCWARLFTLTVPLSTQVYKCTGYLLGKPNKLWGRDLRWTSIPSRGSGNAPSRFMLLKPGFAPAAMSTSWLQGFTSIPSCPPCTHTLKNKMIRLNLKTFCIANRNKFIFFSSLRLR